MSPSTLATHLNQFGETGFDGIHWRVCEWGGREPVDQMKGAKKRGEAPRRPGQINPSRTQI